MQSRRALSDRGGEATMQTVAVSQPRRGSEHPMIVSAPREAAVGSGTWTSPPLFTLSADRDCLERRFGPPHRFEHAAGGAGLLAVWQIRFACGLEVALRLAQDSSQPGRCQVHASQCDVDHVLFHLGPPETALRDWGPASGLAVKPPFRVVRLDDNGYMAELGLFTSRCEADATAKMYEERGHKQTYWVERVE
jgi:hypothetical protein